RAIGSLVELVKVHRVGAFGAGCDIGDLAFFAHIADGHAVGAIGHRPQTQCHTVVGTCIRADAKGGRTFRLGPRACTERGRVRTVGAAHPTDGGALVACGPGAVAEGRSRISRSLRTDEPVCGAAHDGRLLARGDAELTHRGAAGTRGFGHQADRGR